MAAWNATYGRNALLSLPANPLPFKIRGAEEGYTVAKYNE